MADLRDLRNRIRVRAYFAVSDASPRLQSTLRSTSPRKTGNLISKTSVVPRGLEATAKADTEYASYLRHGTRANYPITPKRKGGRLVFFWPGPRGPNAVVYLVKVNHPGIKSNDWWDNALRKWPDHLRDSLRRAP